MTIRTGPEVETMLRRAAKTLQDLAWAPGVRTTAPVYRAYLDVAWAIPDFDYVLKPGAAAEPEAKIR